MTKLVGLSLALCAGSLLAGCATQPQYTWLPTAGSGVNGAQIEARCDYETSAATQGTDYSFRSSLGQELDRAMRKQSLFEKCMLANGMRKAYAGTPDSKPTDPRWTALEADWEASGQRRRDLHKQLMSNPTGPAAGEMRAEIQSLNVKIRELERKLSYAPSQPVAIE